MSLKKIPPRNENGKNLALKRYLSPLYRDRRRKSEKKKVVYVFKDLQVDRHTQRIFLSLNRHAVTYLGIELVLL